MTVALLALSFLAQDLQRPQHGSAVRVTTVDMTELSDKQRRLEEAGLLDRDPKAMRIRAALAPVKERPRPGALVRFPVTPVEAAPRPRLAELLPGAVSPDTPRSLSGFVALDDNLTSTPPDSAGAVGPRHVMTTLNSEVLIQDRQGRVLSRVILEDFWKPTGTVNTAFDPRLLYDRARDRWVFCALAEPQSSNAVVLIGVTQTGDPTGRWNLFRIGGEFNGAWTDYPTMALAGPWVIITTNRFSLTTDRFTAAGIFVFTKEDLYNGRGAFRVFTDRVAGAPIHDDARSDRAAIVSSANGPRGTLFVAEVRGVPGEETYAANTTVLTAADPWAFEPPEDNFAPQLDSTAKLNLGDDRMLQCVARNSSVWCAHNVFLPVLAPTRGAVQWHEIAITTTGYTLTRSGRIEDPAQSFAYPSLAINKNNDVLLGYSRFSDKQFASANFAFRAGTDPAGQFQSDSVFKQGEAPYKSRTANNRWGDYSQTVLDPTDELTMWTLQEYAGSPTASGVARWATWWGAVTPLPAGSAACSYALSNTTLNVSGNGGSLTLNVSTRPECRWMAAPNASWLTTTAGTPGQGNGTVSITAAANRSAAERRSTITVGGTNVTVVQAAGADVAELVVTSMTAPTSVTLGRAFNVSSLVRNQGSRATGAFAIGFYVSTRAVVTTNDTFTGYSCTVDNGLTPGQGITCGGSIQLPVSLTPGTYFIAAVADYQNRLQLQFRDNAIRASDAGATSVNLPADGPLFTSRGVTNAASNAASTVSPGQIVTIYGTRMGPAALQGAQLQNNRLVTTLAGTSVTFDGTAAPLIYVSAGQMAAIAPFNLAGKTQTRMQIVANGLPSEIITVPVAALAPAFFTTDFSGRGAVAALNQDSSVNTAGNPVARGQVIQLFATGFGALDPVVPDGSVIAAPFPRLTVPVTVRIGGVNAAVAYAGPAPGLAAGVVQINATVPPTVGTGAVTLEVTAGSVTGPAGTTIFVR